MGFKSFHEVFWWNSQGPATFMNFLKHSIRLAHIRGHLTACKAPSSKALSSYAGKLMLILGRQWKHLQRIRNLWRCYQSGPALSSDQTGPLQRHSKSIALFCTYSNFPTVRKDRSHSFNSQWTSSWHFNSNWWCDKKNHYQLSIISTLHTAMWSSQNENQAYGWPCLKISLFILFFRLSRLWSCCNWRWVWGTGLFKGR